MTTTTATTNSMNEKDEQPNDIMAEGGQVQSQILLELSQSSNNPNSDRQQQHQAGRSEEGRVTESTEGPLMTSTTASFPFTPSTLVAAVPSPINARHGPIPPNPGHHPPGRQIHSTGSIGQRRQQHTSFFDPNNDIHASPHPHHLHPRHSASSSSNRFLHNSKRTTLSMHSNSHRNNGHNDTTNGKRQPQRSSQGFDLTYSTSPGDPRFQNLPSLWHVLHRKTLPPVCLFNFYLYMRDHEKSSEEVDFWLDVTAHELLWRLYVRATKRRLAQERAEREMMYLEHQQQEGMERERERGGGEGIEAKQLITQEQDEEERPSSFRSHHKKPSVTPDMYEPHLSAANRFLELSEKASDAHSSAASSSADLHGGMQQPQPHLSLGMTEIEREIHLPGPVPDSWERIEDNHRSEQDTTAQKTTPEGSSAYIGSSPHTDSERSGSPNITEGSGRGVGAGVGSGAGAGGVGVGQELGASHYRSGTIGISSSATTKKRTIASVGSGATKEDLQKSAERIYYKYLIPQAEKPVRIPDTVRRRIALFMDGKVMGEAVATTSSTMTGFEGQVSTTTTTTSSSGAVTSPTGRHALDPSAAHSTASPIPSSENSGSQKRDLQFQSEPQHPNRQSSSSVGVQATTLLQPDQDLGLVFSEAREIVFEGMESYYFPRFLKARAYGNMVHAHRVTRAVLGLFTLFIGFVMVLCMIFLNLRPRSLRAWALIPIFTGILLCTTFQFNICPLMAMFGVSEVKWMQFAKIKEPYILKLHRGRAIKVLVVAVLYTACVGIVFGLIPGHRL